MPQGEVIPFEQVLELSKLWYADRMSPDFSGLSTEEAYQIFAQMGWRTDFWRFDAPSAETGQ